MTAHDVVARVRKIARMKQVGHAGTLDPMARGVLPVALGRATRLLRFLQDDKVYKAAVLFGKSTDTDDIEGKEIASSDRIPEQSEISEALKNFMGTIEQVPPAYSAIHVGGERLYNLARKGELPAEIPSRRVTVHSIESLGYSAGVLELRIHCSTGTYIRSIARDLGLALGTHACLSALERERAGPFEISESSSLEKLVEAAAADTLGNLFESPERKLFLPRVELHADQYKRLGFGQKLECENPFGAQEAAAPDQYVMAMYDGKVAGVCLLLPKQSHENTLSEPSSFIVELKPEVVLFDGSIH